ncbi:MAG: sigma-70 family RNA polymerase sigma factor [bacterium]|nr:sigma-70 family RNA polymerase sigma factor [bacterium]
MNNNRLQAFKELPNIFNEEELIEHFKNLQMGNIDERNIIIEHNIKLVLYIINHEFYNTTFPTEDLLSYGLIGLIRAVDTFDITKNIKFSTYATRCIKNEIGSFLRKQKNHLEIYNFDEDIYCDDENDSFSLKHILPDKSIDFVTEIENRDFYIFIKDLINNLPENILLDSHKQVMNLRFGFIDGKLHSAKEIASMLNFTTPHIFTIINRCFYKIRKILETKYNQDNCYNLKRSYFQDKRI